ncbi:MAG: transporter substrate-binding protein [Naasia sp.]|nr:transporter substrate-binding protein [Naasia sp.]
MNQRRLTVLAALAAATLALSGCSGGGGDTPTGDGEGTAEGTLRVGLISASAGAFAFQGEKLKEGVEFALAQQGDQVNGTRIELVTEDEGTTTAEALTAARRLVQRDPVDVIIGPTGSATSVAVAEEVADRDLATVILPLALTDELTSEALRPNLFRVQTTAAQANGPFGTYAAEELGYKRIAVLATDFPAGRDSAAAFSAAFEDAGGDVVTEIFPPLGQADFGPFFSQIDTGSIDAVYAWFSGPDAVKFVNQYDSLGLKETTPLIGFAGLNEEFILEQVNPAAVGAVTVTPYTPFIEEEANTSFVEAYTEEFGEAPALPAANAWVAVQAIHAALEGLDGPYTGDREAFNESLAGIQIDTPRGPISFDDNQQAITNLYITETAITGGVIGNKVRTVLEEVAQ